MYQLPARKYLARSRRGLFSAIVLLSLLSLLAAQVSIALASRGDSLQAAHASASWRIAFLDSSAFSSTTSGTHLS
jgi:hypothetical protein